MDLLIRYETAFLRRINPPPMAIYHSSHPSRHAIFRMHVHQSIPHHFGRKTAADSVIGAAFGGVHTECPTL